jgi:hypothetical protein
MTEEILFDPRILVGYAELFLGVNIKVVCPFLVQKLVFCVQNFEPTCNIVISEAQ